MKKNGWIPWLLLAGMLLCTWGCSDNAAAEDAAGTDEQNTETAEETLDLSLRENTPDSLSRDLDFEGTAVRVSNRGQDDYVAYEMPVEEPSGDIVEDALYARDRSVEERLNVEIVYTVGAFDASEYMRNIHTVLMAGDDAFDYIIGVQWCLLPQVYEGLYHELSDAPYLDWSQPWWNTRYMDTVSVNTDTHFVLAGDISLNMLRNLSCMYYNKTLYGSLYEDADGLYEIVLDGAWTHEKLRTMAAEAYQDINGNGVQDPEDRLGLGVNAVTQADHFSYAAGICMSGRDEDGYPVLLEDQTRNIAVIDALRRLHYETVGVLAYNESDQFTTMTTDFMEGNALFLANRLMNADYLREMEIPYGVIPMPKLDESQENYISLVHDATPLYCIPLTVSDISLPCAVLEALCAESYRTVTPAYYEMALKVKYAHDEMSGQIIDIIHAGMCTDFIYANDSSVGSNVGHMARVLVPDAGKAYTSYFESVRRAAERNLQNIIDHAQKAIEDS